MRRLAPLLLAGLVISCVNQLAAREAYLRQFIGQPEAAVVQQMGVPNRSIETGGVTYLAYEEHHVDIIPGAPGFGPWGYGWAGGGFAPQIIDWRCETTFEVVNATVRAFTLRGNGCG